MSSYFCICCSVYHYSTVMLLPVMMRMRMLILTSVGANTCIELDMDQELFSVTCAY